MNEWMNEWNEVKMLLITEKNSQENENLEWPLAKVDCRL